MHLFSVLFLIVVLSSDFTGGRSRHATNRLSNWQENDLNSDENLRPIVGILSLEPPDSFKHVFKTCQSYIASSYVKFVEMAGARVVPILIDRQAEYYEKVFNGINGLLIPGGGIDLSNLNSSGFGQAGQALFNMAVQANDKGDHFPILGICLGSEMLSILIDPKHTYHLTSCSCTNVALPLNMTKGFEKSRLFNKLPSDVLASLTTRNVTVNFHQKCLTPENVFNSTLNTTINVLSTNKDVNGVTFVSTYEVKKYPFYALQWHPEKNPYEWSLQETSLPHTPEAIRVTQHMANFFIGEVRKNSHKFANEKEEQEALIYNHRAYATFNVKTNFTEVYWFKNTTKEPFH